MIPLNSPQAERNAREAALTTGVVGKHAVYFEFLSDADGEIASFDRFTFTRAASRTIERQILKVRIPT